MFCLLVCFVYLIFSSERVKRVIVLTLSVQSLGRGLFSSMQRGFRLRLRESHGLEIHVTLCVLLTGRPIVVTHMKSVVARECCRSVSSQSGRQLQLEPEASFIFLKNFRAFFTLKSCFWRDECFKVL